MVSKSKTNSSQAYDIHLREWEEARNVLIKFDEYLHDLRKYGFSFITTLLTAQSLLIPNTVANNASIPDAVKLAILVVTLGLIVALRLIERLYQLFQEAAAGRAKILERVLNIELTDVISDRYTRSKAWRYIDMVYIAFMVATYLLGYAILPFWPYLTILLIGTIMAYASVVMSSLNYIPLHGKVDWTIDPLQCKSGEKVTITLTNLGRDPFLISQDAVVFEISTQDYKVIYQQKALNDITIFGDEDSYTWTWDTTGFKSDIYRVAPCYPSKWKRSLRGKITII